MTASIDILTAPVAMVIELRASGQIDDKRWHELLAERPDLASAWASDPRGGGGSGWQPIETAPKDGTRIILFRRGHIVCGHWDTDRIALRPRPFWTHDNVRIFGVTDARSVRPTHWMPLPAPPATLTQGAGDER